MKNNEISKHILITEYETVKRLCEPLIKFGIIGFIYMKRYPDHSFIDLSNQLNWSLYFLDNYFKEKYPANFIQNHMFNSNGIDLWNSQPDNIIWREGGELFGFGNGISLYFNDKNFVESFCFYSMNNNYSINQLYVNHLDTLKKFSHYFRDKMAPIIKKAERENNKLFAPHYYLDYQSSPDIKDITVHQSICDFKSTLENIISENETKILDKNPLTKREMECLKWFASGKSSKMIAQILKISPRTVELHIQNAKQKLNYKNTRQLVFDIFNKNIFNINV